MIGKRAAAVAERRRDLIAATAATIHAKGSREVAIAGIANRAGIGPGLAHHHSGSGNGPISATLRHLRRDGSRGEIPTPQGRP